MWIKSKLYESLKEQDEDAPLQDCFNENPLCEHLNDLLQLNITKENYLKLIELCDFLMVTNVDVLVDKIVERFGIHIIHEFGDFYKYNSERLQVHNRKSLREAIKSYFIDPEGYYKTYGFSAYWNVSNIIDMSYLFHKKNFRQYENIDLSQWDVSKVTTMEYMFSETRFNGNISQWNVSNVKNMKNMFCHSEFNGNISQWNVSKVRDMDSMFENTPFNNDISQWDVYKVRTMVSMFENSKFNGDISQWNVSKIQKS